MAEPRTITVQAQGRTRAVQTALTVPEATQVLAGTKSSFALDLLQQHRRRGLSARQQDWLCVLAQETLDAARRDQQPRQQLGDFGPIQELFARTNGRLQHPRIRLQAGDGRPVWLSRAGANSRHAGSISVTNGERFGTPGSFYGRIDQDGSTTVRDETVLELLRRFAADPVAVATEYGKLTGACCFCKQDLTDERSVDVGYGPICAGHYGLPWGHRPGREPAPRPAR